MSCRSRPSTRDVEHERQVAIFDLLEDNSFQPAGAEGGPYALKISLVEDGRLALDIAGPRLREAATCCRCRP